jgi:transcriptional regulator with XRE-family HTH domain
MIFLSSDVNWETEIIGNVKKNITWLLERNYRNSQTSMAKDLDVKANTLYTYINTETRPPLTFICKLCNKVNLSIDSFIYQDLELEEKKLKKKDAIKKVFSNYKENYYVYFFVIDSNSLKEGLIQEGELSISDTGDVSFEILHSKKQFIGKLSISDELAYFDLKNSKEKFSITIKSPGKNIREKYIGGIGITNISSPEDTRIPCAQKIIISAARIPIDKYYSVLKEFLAINTYFKIRKNLLFDFLNNIIDINTDKYEKLKYLLDDNKVSGEDKIIIEENLLSLFREVLDKQEYLQLKSLKDIIPFNSVKIGLEEDKMFYRFIKNEFNALLQV